MNQIVIGAAVIIALGVAYKVNNAAVREVAVQNERASVETKAKKKDATAQTARAAAAAKPYGLLSRHCRDCGQSGAVSIVAPGDGFETRPADKTDGRGNRGQ